MDTVSLIDIPEQSGFGPAASRPTVKLSLIRHFLNNVDATPQKTAIWVGEYAHSYESVAGKTARLCTRLQTMGVKRHTRLLVCLDNGIEFAVAMLAAAELGAVLVPMSPSSGPTALRNAIAHTQCEFLLAHSRVVSRFPPDSFPLPTENCLLCGPHLDGSRSFEEINDTPTTSYVLGRNSLNGESPYILTMTSGSTGEPKPIILSQVNKLHRSLSGARDLYGLNSDDVIIAASPMYHSLGQRLLLLPLLIGATAVIVKKFNTKRWLSAVAGRGVTFTIAVSSHLEMLLNAPERHQYDLRSLRCIVSSSSLLKTATKRQFIDSFSCEFHECYGTSEVGIVTNLAPTDDPKYIGTVGKALPYVDLRIIDERGNILPTGETGEIACRSLTTFSGYDGLPATTRDSVVRGYFRTGDLGYLDADDYLHFCGRRKDLIIVGGTNVYPKDIETVLLSHPSVEECAVIGVDDSRFGEVAIAVIVAPPDHIDVRELQRLCTQELADYQQPMAYEFVETLPKTALGKIIKPQLRDQYKHYDATQKLRKLF